jgi:outer membrane receptor protein involved in Fe transport
MPSSRAIWVTRWLAIVSLCLVCSTLVCAQSTGGRILGRVADPSGAVLANVNVTAVNESTGVSRDTKTNEGGDYVFPEVPVGVYTISFDLAGFKTNVRKSVTLELNQVITLNTTMQIGETRETVEVTSEAPLVDTTSTQLGTVVNDRAITQLPLNQRDTYQFLSLQPGVQSQVGADLYYGGDSSGSVSVNGGRGRANNFSVNGGDANDSFVNLPTVNPSPDSVEEFRIITNSFDAEYGRNSGSVVNVVTKSGTNDFHGNVYEFFRNKVLNSKGYFDTSKGKYNQNQFGATFGGPIRKDHTFFFLSYEGNRLRVGQSGDTVNVPTGPEAGGDFSQNPQGLPFSGVIDPQTGFVAAMLNGRADPATGQTCPAAIAALNGTPPAPGVAWSAIFPTNVIPVACQDPVARDLLRFVPAANTGNGVYQAVLTGQNRQDQATLRVDHRINDKQSFSAYYYFTDTTRFDPFNFFQAAGANVGGFGAHARSRYQQLNLSHTWTLTNTTVNEVRFTYMREGQRTFNHPQKTNNVVDSCTSAAAAFCFTGFSDSSAVNNLDPSGQGNRKFGITPGLGPNREGVPDISVSGGAVIGNNFEGELPQVGNSFQWTDSLTMVKGNHTMKFGGDIRRMRFDQTLYFEVSGYYQYFGGGPNDPGYFTQDNSGNQTQNLYPNYLLGLPDSYQQGSAQNEHVRASALYLFAQDSWKVRPNLTFNYGVRWELNTPLNDIGHRVQTFRPGQATKIYPCLNTGSNDCASEFPTGLVFPGDPGVPNGLTQTYYKALAPRVGVAWDPWKNGKTSIRAGWGMFYNPIEQLVLEQFSAEPPFGISLGASNTLFNTPFIGQDGSIAPNGANGILDPPRGQPLDWSVYRPILLFGEFQPHMRSQYSDQYNLNIERELTKDLQLQVGYVGSQGHRLLASRDINPGNPQTCLDINTVQGAGTCGAFGEDSQYQLIVPQNFVFHLPNGKTVTGGAGGTPLNLVGLRPYSSPNCDPVANTGCPPDGQVVFTNIFAEDTNTSSSYNSLQVSLQKRFSHGLQSQVAYTWSKSMDLASSFEDFLDPFNPRKTRSLSLYDARQRFVVSYVWELPIPKKSGFEGAALNGWAFSGITQFQSGFPIHIQSWDDQDLTGNAGIGFSSPTVPDQIAPFKKIDPHTSASNPNNLGFDPNSFALSALGSSGNARRTICCGPGFNNWDVSLQKNNQLSERFRTEFRLDVFNVANHTKFFNPDGNITDGADFGRVKRAGPPRLMQFALKLYF